RLQEAFAPPWPSAPGARSLFPSPQDGLAIPIRSLATPRRNSLARLRDDPQGPWQLIRPAPSFGQLRLTLFPAATFAPSRSGQRSIALWSAKTRTAVERRPGQTGTRNFWGA